MSLSTCEKCGGHIPLGPDASNRCEKCGEHVLGPGFHPAKKPMEGGFSLDKFMPSLPPEDAEALGKMLDDMEAEKEARRKAADDAAGALDLLSRVRFALGDNGARMQDELIAYCAELRDRLTIAPGPFLFEFTSFDHWADTAQAQFKKAEHNSTNTICLDAKGRTCWRGKDFMQARDENTFPVRVFSLIR